MSRGRRGIKSALPPTFGGVDHYIGTMERAVVNRSITPSFNADDMLDWLLPPETRHILRAAMPIVQGNHPSWDIVMPSFTNNAVENDATLQDATLHLHFNTMELDSLPPKDWDGPYPFQDTFSAPDIVATLIEIEQIVGQFNIVRKITQWFNSNKVTPGAARQYFPAMGSLLPADHAFHQTDGQRYKEVYFPHEITQALRAAPEIIAKGLLCDPEAHAIKVGKAVVTVSVTRDDIGGQNLVLFTKGP